MDSTRKARWRLRCRALTVIAVATLSSLWMTGSARADGDPASDVLATQALFLPQDAGTSLQQQAQLAALLSEARRKGYRIRAAVIASATDLGAVSELWRAPQAYAHFLGQELSLVYRGVLLVVMPNGYGVYGVGGAAARPSVLRGLAPPAADFGPAAVVAIRRLAAASGHVLPLPRATGPRVHGSTSPMPWVVFGLGLILIVAAWTISLRLRPLSARTKPPTPA